MTLKYLIVISWKEQYLIQSLLKNEITIESKDRIYHSLNNFKFYFYLQFKKVFAY